MSFRILTFIVLFFFSLFSFAGLNILDLKQNSSLGVSTSKDSSNSRTNSLDLFYAIDESLILLTTYSTTRPPSEDLDYETALFSLGFRLGSPIDLITSGLDYEYWGIQSEFTTKAIYWPVSLKLTDWELQTTLSYRHIEFSTDSDFLRNQLDIELYSTSYQQEIDYYGFDKWSLGAFFEIFNYNTPLSGLTDEFADLVVSFVTVNFGSGLLKSRGGINLSYDFGFIQSSFSIRQATTQANNSQSRAAQIDFNFPLNEKWTLEIGLGNLHPVNYDGNVTRFGSLGTTYTW